LFLEAIISNLINNNTTNNTSNPGNQIFLTNLNINNTNYGTPNNQNSKNDYQYPNMYLNEQHETAAFQNNRMNKLVNNSHNTFDIKTTQTNVNTNNHSTNYLIDSFQKNSSAKKLDYQEFQKEEFQLNNFNYNPFNYDSPSINYLVGGAIPNFGIDTTQMLLYPDVNNAYQVRNENLSFADFLREQKFN